MVLNRRFVSELSVWMGHDPHCPHSFFTLHHPFRRRLQLTRVEIKDDMNIGFEHSGAYVFGFHYEIGASPRQSIFPLGRLSARITSQSWGVSSEPKDLGFSLDPLTSIVTNL